MAKQNNKNPNTPQPSPRSASSPPLFLGGKESEKAAKAYLDDLERAQIETADLNDLAKELSSTWKDLSNAIGKANEHQSVLGDNASDYQDLIKNVYANIKNIGTENFKDLKVQDKLKKLQEERLDAAKDLEDTTKSLNATDDHINKLHEKRLKVEQMALDAALSGNEHTVEAARRLLETYDTSIAQLEVERDALSVRQGSLETTVAQIAAAEDLLQPLSHAADIMEKANKKAHEFGVSIDEMSSHLMAPFEKALGFLDKVPGGGIMKSFFGIDKKLEVVQKAITDSFISGLATTGSVGSASFAALRAGATAFMTSLGPILVPLIAIAAAAYAVKKALDMDKEVSEMARGLGMSKKEALGIRKELNDMAASTKVVGASTEELVKEYQVLAKTFGVSKIANKEMAETQVYLTKQLGMASDEAANFQSMSMATGRTAYQNLAVIKAGVESMTGGLMNYKEVANDIAKSSKSVQAAYKGNISALTKAVITAKKFGMTLDETKKSADAILDIESSVESEMKANVLTGKHMNLNAARQLALQGKSAEAVEEMMKQAGGYDELMDMAPYKQKAIADAMGMSVDEMIKAAEHQKNLNTMASELGITLDENGKMSEEAMKIAMASNNEEAKKLAIQQQVTSAQEKLSAIGDKLMTIFAQIAEPIMEMLDPLFTLIDVVFPLIKHGLDMAFAPLKFTFNMIASIVKLLTGDFSGALDSIKNAFTSLIPSWARKLLGIGSDKSEEAMSSGAGNTTNLNDAMIGPDGGLVVKGAKGTYQLNENDSIIAGTNLQSSAGSTTAAPAATQNSSNAEIVSLLKELIAKVEQPVKINIGSRVIEELESQASMRRSYNTKIDGAYGANG